MQEPTRDEQAELEALNEQQLARQRRPRGPTTAREAVGRLMARRGYGQTKGRNQLSSLWQQACGELLAAHTRAGNLSRGVLTVFVSNSMVLQELTIQQRQLVERLRELDPETAVRSLRLRVGAVD